MGENANAKGSPTTSINAVEDAFLARLSVDPEEEKENAVEDGFLARLRASPNDDDNRLVYADWLEEHGRTDACEFLRLQTSLRKMSLKPEGDTDPAFETSGVRLRELALRVDQKWRSLVAHAPIEGCPVRFDFKCPKQWDALLPTELGDKVRFCSGCQKNVHYVATLAEANAHARQGHCVVVDLAALRRKGDLDTSPVFVVPDDMPMLPAGAPVPWNPPPPPSDLAEPTAPDDPDADDASSVLGRLKKALKL